MAKSSDQRPKDNLPKTPKQSNNAEGGEAESVEEVIPPEVAKVIKGLPKEKQQVLIRALSIQHRSGPLPSSDEIKVYAEVIPNGGDRLMSTVETQLNHRIDIEKSSVKRSYNQSSTGQWMAFFLALFFGAISWDLAKNGQTTAASIIGAVDIVGLVAVFITGRVKKR